MNKIPNPKVIQEEEKRNSKEGVLPQNRTLNKSKRLLFICIGKWANDGLKTKSLISSPTCLPSTRQRLIRCGEPESCLLIYAPFALTNPRLHLCLLRLHCGEAFPSQRRTSSSRRATYCRSTTSSSLDFYHYFV